MGGSISEQLGLGKWRFVLSPVAIRLWRLLDEQQDKAPTIRLADLTRDLHASKTAVRRAMSELAEHGFIAVIDDGNDTL